MQKRKIARLLLDNEIQRGSKCCVQEMEKGKISLQLKNVGLRLPPRYSPYFSVNWSQSE